MPAAQAFADKMQQAIIDAKTALEAAQQRQKKHADSRRRPVTLNIGDEALLSSKNIRIRNPGGTLKLLPRWIGPFTYHRPRQPS